MSAEASKNLSSNLNAIAHEVWKENHNNRGLKLDDMIRWLIFMIITAGAVIYVCDLIIRCLNRAESISEWMAPP
jgi:hypothetical protein